MNAFNKAKNLWYSDYSKGHNLLNKGYDGKVVDRIYNKLIRNGF
jgi:hypothetical protein